MRYGQLLHRTWLRDRDGQLVEVGAWLVHGPLGDRLQMHAPPGGEALVVRGLGRRRWCDLASRERDQIMVTAVDRMREAMARTVAGECPADEQFVASYPGIHEFLGLSRLKDGSPRARSKLTIFYDGPVFKCSLTEPDSECSAFVTSDSFLGVLAALEEAIQGDSLDWRRWWSGVKPGRASRKG